MDDLSEKDGDYLVKDYHRPPGYAAHTQVSVGRMVIPVLLDSGATCSCMSEEQMILIINHQMKMQEENLLDTKSYNHPIRQIYKFNHPGELTGASATGGDGFRRMTVEYAVVLRVEFIPDGNTTGPTRDIYFKIFRKGSCGITGLIFGWPTLDYPIAPGGEGLGWRNWANACEFQSLKVMLPRLDEHRRDKYYTDVAMYKQNQGSIVAIKDTSQETCARLAEVESAMTIQAVSGKLDKYPFAIVDVGCGGSSFSMQPGERAVVPVTWQSYSKGVGLDRCSTHPRAQPGVRVLPGECEDKEKMSLVIENEAALPIQISEGEILAIGTQEDAIPTMESCLDVARQRAHFQDKLDWNGSGKDTVREIPSGREGHKIV